MLIEAQTGQGKSIFAAQFVADLGSDAVSAHDHARLCFLLLSDLRLFLPRDFYLVFDDGYRLDGPWLSCGQVRPQKSD